MIQNQNIIKFFLLSLALFFTRGTIVGDEEKIYLFANEFLNSNKNLFDYLKSVSGSCDLYDKCNYNYLGHHLFWFFYHVFVLKIFSYFEIFVTFFGLNTRIFNELILSLTSTLIIIFSILILINTFNKNKSNWIYVYSIFAGSYGIGFINGGFTECLIILLISIKLFLKEKNTKNKILYLSLIDIYIIFLKPYLLVFIILFNLTYNLNKKDILKYFLYCLFLFIIFSLIKFSIKIDYLSYYNEGLDLNINKIINRTFYFLFSPSVGIILTCPFLVLSLVSIKKNKIIKLTIILFYSIFFSFYGDLAFWGGAGIGGSRYIFPIFLIFIDDYINFLNKLNYKFKRFLISLFFISFIPSMDYKNTNIALVPEQTGQIIIDSVSNYPLEDFNLNPIYLSWKIFIYKDLLNSEKIEFKIKNKNYTLKSSNIMPDTIISKLSHVSNKDFLNTKYFYSHWKNKKKLIDKISNYSFELKLFKFLIVFIYTSLFIYAISRQTKK